MADIFDRYAKTPPRQRYAVFGLVVALAIGAFYYVFYSGDVERLQGKEAENRKLEEERAEKQAYVDNLARYEARLSDMQRNLNAARAQLPDAADVAQLLAQLGNKARQAGMTIEKFEPQGETAKDFFAEIAFALTVRGSYQDITSFIDAVGKLDRIINVSDISIGTPKTQNKKVILNGTFRLKTYRFISTEPVAGGKK